jgi:hypothetical protein
MMGCVGAAVALAGTTISFSQELCIQKIEYYELMYLYDMSSRRKTTHHRRIQKKAKRGPCGGHVGPAYPGTLPTTGLRQPPGPIFQLT